MKEWLENNDVEIVTIGIAIMLIGLILMAFTGCAAPVATQLPKAEAEATGIGTRAETTMDTISTQPSGIASAGAPVRADKTGDVNVGAGSGGAWPLLAGLCFIVAAYFGIQYLKFSKLLKIVTRAVQVAPDFASDAVKDAVKEGANKLWQWVLDRWVKSKGTKA